MRLIYFYIGVLDTHAADLFLHQCVRYPCKWFLRQCARYPRGWWISTSVCSIWMQLSKDQDADDGNRRESRMCLTWSGPSTFPFSSGAHDIPSCHILHSHLLTFTEFVSYTFSLLIFLSTNWVSWIMIKYIHFFTLIQENIFHLITFHAVPRFLGINCWCIC